MIEFFNRILFSISRTVAWLGMIFLLGAVLVTTTDIILRQVSDQGIFGAVDIVQLMVMSAAYLSIPYGFLTNGHVSVTLVVDHFGRRMTAVSTLLSAIAATGFMFAIAWFGYSQAMMQYGYGDISLTLGIPKIYYWIPLLFGSALSAVICVHLSVEAIYTVLSGKSGLTSQIQSESN